MFARMLAVSVSTATVILTALMAFTFSLDHHPQPWPWVFGAFFGFGALYAVRQMWSEMAFKMDEWVRR